MQLERFRPCLVFFFFVTQFLQLITLKYYVCLALSFTSHPSIYFHTIYGTHTCHSGQLFFFFSLVSKPTEPSEKKKKKKNPEHEDRTNERRRNPEQTKPVKKKIPQNSLNQWKKKGKKNWIVKSGEERKKKVKRWSKCATGYCLWVPYVCLITILSLNYKLWKLKIAKICFQFP